MNLVNCWGSLKNKFAFSDHSFMQPQDGRIPCPEDRNLEICSTSHVDFLCIFRQCGDNCK